MTSLFVLPRQTALDLDFDLPQIAVVGGQSVGKLLGVVGCFILNHVVFY